MSELTRQKMVTASELLRKGATLMNEPCPKCGGVQVRFKGRDLCVNCGNLAEATKIESISPSDLNERLRDVTLSKAKEVISLLVEEKDVEKQSKMADLLLKYVDLLDKLKAEKKTK